MSRDIHAHEVLRMMEGNSYSVESLVAAIETKFGADARFHTCSAEGLDASGIVAFLESKGKFKTADGGFMMDIDKVCDSY